MAPRLLHVLNRVSRTLPSLPLLAAMAACDAAPRMHVERSTVAVGDDVIVVFDDALEGRAANQFWVALQPANAPLDDTTGRVILERTDHTARLHAGDRGDYEVRLHGGYPKTDAHLLARIPIKVDGFRVQTGIAPLPDPNECLDRWLAARSLDAFGSAKGTTYPNGSPLVDPSTKSGTSRWDYVTAKHPEVEADCAAR